LWDQLAGEHGRGRSLCQSGNAAYWTGL
jgi:hypothetical protein